MWFQKHELSFNMKHILTVCLFLVSMRIFAQKSPEDFGFKHLKLFYKTQLVDVIIQSKKGEESFKKPLFFWCQGSLPQPVIKYSSTGVYQTFPFDTNDFLDEFHLVIIGKPQIQVIADVKDLKKNYIVADDSLRIPKGYSDNNYLDFYVKRNNYILKKLLKEKWVSKKIVVVAGHSEGSTIAAKMASTNKKITHLIYSGGNPYGRFLNILAQSRYNNDSNQSIEYWKEIVKNKNDLTYNGGDTFKCSYDFSQPLGTEMMRLKIPILVSYGTKDWNLPYADLFYIETIRKKMNNFTFKTYIGLEHNYFQVNEKLEPNYEIYNWENVGKDWIKWLNQTKK